MSNNMDKKAAGDIPMYAVVPSDAKRNGDHVDQSTELRGSNAGGDSRAASPATNVESATGGRIRNLIRQNSVLMTGAAEAVVLPKTRRSIKRDLETGEVVIPVKKSFPYFIVLISLVEIFQYYVANGDFIQTALWYDPYRRHEIWRYFTVMLLHSSASHLWGNIIFQMILGCLLEMVHHWRRVGAVYICGVLGGSLALTVIDPKSYAVGCSAAVYALLAAHLVTLIMNWQEMERRVCRIVWLLLYIAFDIALALYITAKSTLKTNTSHAGHFGGALAGFLVGVCVLKNFRTLAWELTFRKICIGIIIFLITAVIIFNVSFPSYYYPTEYSTDYMESILRRVCKDEDVYKLIPEACQEVMVFPDTHNSTASSISKN